MTVVVHPGDSLTPRQRLIYVLVLGALAALGSFTIDTYVPALPDLQRDFGVPVARIDLTLTATTIGFAAGQLVVGPWSDKVGRRLPLILAASLHIVASIGVALSPTIDVLTVFRLLQGVGAAAGAVVAMAMVRDLFGGRPLVRMLSRLALVSGLAPVIAPVLGSQLLLIMPWRGIFWVLAGYGSLVLICVLAYIVETLPAERRARTGHSTARERYRAIFSDRVFLGVALLGGMAYSGLFAYLSASTFLFQSVYHFPPQEYGLLFAINSIGLIIGVQTSARLTRRIGPQWILVFSTSLMLASGVTISSLSLAGAGLWGTLIPLWFFVAGFGFSFPCLQVLGLNGHPNEAATAASVLGATNFGFAGLAAPLVGAIGVTNALPMGTVMAGAATVGMFSLMLIVRPWSVPALAH